jgi:hypothetical protein
MSLNICVLVPQILLLKNENTDRYDGAHLKSQLLCRLRQINLGKGSSKNLSQKHKQQGLRMQLKQ